MFEGLGLSKRPNPFNEIFVAGAFHGAGGFPRLALEKPVDDGDLAVAFPPAHCLVGLLILPAAKEQKTCEHVLDGVSQEEQQEWRHNYRSLGATYPSGQPRESPHSSWLRSCSSMACDHWWSTPVWYRTVPVMRMTTQNQNQNLRWLALRARSSSCNRITASRSSCARFFFMASIRAWRCASGALAACRWISSKTSWSRSRIIPARLRP